jgi:hypothetical protein
VKRCSANRPFRLQRLVHFGALLRAFACLLTLSFAIGGYVAATAPLHGMAMAGMPAGDEECGHHAAPSVAKHGHASDTCCRSTCACALGHALGGVPALACASDNLVSTSLPLLRAYGVRHVRGEPPLRPPIA